jgi:biopolymer transport protein ExbD
MQLKRTKSPQRLISLVSMIDVLLIMLVFFMVTSTYLNLDMIPMAKSSDETASTTPATETQTVMIRLGGDGRTYLQGRPTQLSKLAATLQSRGSNTSVLILPSARASTQNLVTLLDTLTTAGLTRLRIVQLEALK